MNAPTLRTATRPAAQGGAIIVTVCLFLLFLLGFMGIALDFGRLFVVKTELQSAADACALAAAVELDGAPLSRERARNAGRAAAAMNLINLQASSWEPADTDITFRDKDLAPTGDDAAAAYVECRHTEGGIGQWLLPAMAAFSGDSDSYPAARAVTASAVATLGSAQSTCLIPVALIPKQCGASPCPAPNYGFTPGEWVEILSNDNNQNNYPQPGEMGWFNLDGTQSAQDTIAQLSNTGACLKVDQSVVLGTPGMKQGVSRVWNYRFGIRPNNETEYTPANQPDLTGFAYSEKSWPQMKDAYPDFVNRRTTFASYQLGGVNGNIATPADHAAYGYNRRVATVPVLSPGSTVQDYACMLLLEPMTHPNDPVYLEYLGNAGEAGSPCVTSGLAGGLAGPNVPVLVQ